MQERSALGRLLNATIVVCGACYILYVAVYLGLDLKSVVARPLRDSVNVRLRLHSNPAPWVQPHIHPSLPPLGLVTSNTQLRVTFARSCPPFYPFPNSLACTLPMQVNTYQAGHALTWASGARAYTAMIALLKSASCSLLVSRSPAPESSYIGGLLATSRCRRFSLSCRMERSRCSCTQRARQERRTPTLTQTASTESATLSRLLKSRCQVCAFPNKIIKRGVDPCLSCHGPEQPGEFAHEIDGGEGKHWA